MTQSHDVRALRDLARRYVEVANRPVRDERRALWRAHASLRSTRVRVLVRWLVGLDEILPESKLECLDGSYRPYERQLRIGLFQDSIGDDTVAESWITQRAYHISPPEGLWGVACRRIPVPQAGGSWKDVAPLVELVDADKLVAPHHRIDEQATAHAHERLQEAVGDILAVNVDRAPAYISYAGDLSTHLAYLRGPEQVMWDMHDNREWLHRVLAFMRDGILATHEEAKAAGDWHLCDHENRAMPYACELADPRANGPSVKRSQLWGHMQAQELTQVSPRMFDQFMLQYQLPIMAEFGLVAYGCCEDLTEKISVLHPIRNLRRIAVTPWADLRACAEQIQRDYVFSWRPNPAEMICHGYDAEHVSKVIRAGLESTRRCVVDITLKDIKTVQGRPDNLHEWVRVVRRIVDERA